MCVSAVAITGAVAVAVADQRLTRQMKMKSKLKTSQSS